MNITFGRTRQGQVCMVWKVVCSKTTGFLSITGVDSHRNTQMSEYGQRDRLLWSLTQGVTESIYIYAHKAHTANWTLMFFKLLDPSSGASKMRMKGYNLPCLILLIVLNIHLNYFGQFCALICSANSLSADGVVLLEMKSSFAVPPNVLSSWRNDSSSDVNPCSWEGVHSSSYGRRVTSIFLPFKGLSCRLSRAIGKIAALEKLDLSGNRLSGMIPSQIANCTEIRELNLAYNFFTGFIPSEIGNCSFLTVLNISTNNISGIILPAMGNLISLTTSDQI